MFFVSALLVIGQINLKSSVMLLDSNHILLSIKNFLFSTPLWIAILSIFMAALLWFYVLYYEKLYVAYPLISLSYVFMALIMHFVYNEPISTTNYLGILFIMFGTLLLFL